MNWRFLNKIKFSQIYRRCICEIWFRLPEDPAYSTPDGSNFFFISGRYARDTVCISVFFFSIISGPFSHNLDRYIGPRSLFFEFFSFFSGYIVPGLFTKIKIDFEQLWWTFISLFNISSSLFYWIFNNGEQKLDSKTSI